MSTIKCECGLPHPQRPGRACPVVKAIFGMGIFTFGGFFIVIWALADTQGVGPLVAAFVGLCAFFALTLLALGRLSSKARHRNASHSWLPFNAILEKEGEHDAIFKVKDGDTRICMGRGDYQISENGNVFLKKGSLPKWFDPPLSCQLK